MLLLFIVLLVVVLFYFIVLFQDFLIYPGILKNCKELKHPFIKIGNSYFKKGTSDQLWIIFGGNNSSPDNFHFFKNSNNNFIIINYPSFCGSDGIMNPLNSFILIDICLKKCKNFIKNLTINFACYSMGCAVGLHYLHKKQININKIVLLAPFYSLESVIFLPEMISFYLLDHTWNNYEFVQSLKCNSIIFIHGKNDNIIDYKQSIKLYNLCKIKKKIKITNDNHESIKKYFLFLNNV